MIRALSSFLPLMLVARSSAQTTQVPNFVSPCPNVFSYDLLATETNKWYGVVNLSTDIPLYALWLNIVLENKANILGNWLGEVTTDDNIDFKIENTNMLIKPEQPLAVRFFVQYNANSTPPKLKAIRFNGREICRVQPQVLERAVPVRAAVTYDEVRPGVTTSTTARPPITTTSRNYNQQQTTKTTTLRPQYWTEAQTSESTLRTTQQTQYWQQTTPTLKPIYWTPAKTEVNPQTTARTPGWSYVKADNNQQVISTAIPGTQTRFQTRTTESNLVSGQVQSLPYSQTKDRNTPTNSQGQLQVQNNQKTNEIKQQITQTAPGWPNELKLTDNQNDSSEAIKRSNFQIEVTQVGNTKYWSKLPPPNTTAVAVKSPSVNQQRAPDGGLQNQPYAKISVNQAESTQNLDRPRDMPLYVRPGDRQRNRTVIQSGVDPSRYPTNDDRIRITDGSRLSINKFQITTELPVPTPSRIEENDNSNQEEFYEGGLPIFFIPLDSGSGSVNAAEATCGNVLLNKQTSQSLKLWSTMEGAWPWLIALYQQQASVELHYKYICGGTLVSRRHVITAAHCVTTKASAKVVNRDTLMIYLGKHNLRTSVEGVQVKFVYSILIYPEYDPMNLRTDLAILKLRDTVTYSSWVQPVCLWPEQETDLQNVVGRKGYTFGWGYDVQNLPREELAQLQMEVVDQRTCLSSHPEFFSRFITDKTYCAGFSSTATCNGRDSGGGMVFQKGGTWYLRGIVSLLVARQGARDNCDPKRYVIFTDVAKFLPWIEDNIED